MQLTDHVLNYQAGSLDWRELWGKLQVHIDEFLGFYSLCPDTQVHFMNQFETRLRGMVERFEYRGISFEALLRRSLHLQLRSVFRHIKKERLMQAFSVSDALAISECNPELSYAPTISHRTDRRPSIEAHRKEKCFDDLPVPQRRCVIAALKNCLHMNDLRCEKLARAFGLNTQWLLKCRDALYHELHPKLEAKRRLGELICHLRTSILADEAIDGPNPTESTRSRRLEARRVRIARLRQRWLGWQITPRHHRIAAVLGIPKGTVDSTLYYLRKTVRQIPARD